MENIKTTFNPTRWLKKALVVTIATCSLSLAGFANAGLLGIDLEASPDIFVKKVSVVYDSNSVLTAIGEASSYFDGTTTQMLTDGTFNLTAMIDNMGIFSPGTGNLTIIDTTGDLLIGNITAFGFENFNEPLEFLFTATGGSLQSKYGSNGGIILSVDIANPSSTDFSASFSTGMPAVSVADVGIRVPEPSALFLMSFALLGLALRRRYTQD